MTYEVIHLLRYKISGQNTEVTRYTSNENITTVTIPFAVITYY